MLLIPGTYFFFLFNDKICAGVGALNWYALTWYILAEAIEGIIIIIMKQLRYHFITAMEIIVITILTIINMLF